MAGKIQYKDGKVGGFLVGRTHKENGIQVKNIDTDEPIEVEDGEVIIMADAVADKTQHEFNGKKMTNIEILSSINESTGGVSLMEMGGKIQDQVRCGCSGKKHRYNGEELTDHEILRRMSEGGGTAQRDIKWAKDFEKLTPEEILVLQFYKSYKPQFRKDNIAKALGSRRSSGTFIQDHKNALIQADQLIEALKRYGFITPQNALSVEGKEALSRASKKWNLSSMLPFDRETYEKWWLPAFETQMEAGGMTGINEANEILQYQAGSAANGAALELARGGKVHDKPLKLLDIPSMVKAFMPPMQQKAIVGSEEHWDVLERLEKIISELPKTYETEDTPTDEKMVYLHYFMGDSDWYIVEKDKDPEQLQAFGYVILNGDDDNAEWGYIDIEAIKETNRVELDFYFEPLKFIELKKRFSGEIEEPSNQSQIAEIANASSDRILFVQSSHGENPQANPQAVPQASIKTAKQQAAINEQIVELVKYKGTNSSKYSAAEIALIKQYSGAGGLSKHGASGPRILDQFFTPMDICAKMWGLAFKYGFNFKNTNVLEPAVGTGNFLQFIPRDARVNVVGYDVDEISSSIAKILFPQYDIQHGSFESMFFNGRRHVGLAGVTTFFDLVIGNPPYREYVSPYAPLGEKNATGAITFEMYFLMRGVDVLKPGGLLIYIIPNTFLSNGNKYNSFKDELVKKADMIDAFRVPNGIFDFTDVGTDIIVLRKKK